MIRVMLLLLVVPAIFIGCSSPKAYADFDPEYDFTGKRTYAWRDGIPSQSQLNQNRIVGSVDDALVSKGLLLMEGSGTPDLWVVTEVARRQEVRSSGGNVSVGVGRRTSWGSVGASTSSATQVYEVTVGTLVIEILDGATGDVAWRAVAEKTLTSMSPEEASQAIQDIVVSAFEDFPPDN